MKQLLITVPVFICCAFIIPAKAPKPAASPLHLYSTEWDNPKYSKCNTAASTSYLTEEEQKIFWILNMARVNPKLFATTVIKQYPELGNHGWLINIYEYKSLLDTMQRMKPLNPLYPDSLLWASAKCHAITSGDSAYVGHERLTEECKKLRKFYGECCDYGYNEALDIIMHLLVDQGVPSLGHRFLMLSNFNKMGVSIQPHKGYRYTTVLDFYW